MASTQQQFNTEVQSLNTYTIAINDDLGELSAQVNAIKANPTQSNAQSKLDIIKERYSTLKAPATGEIDTKIYNLSNTLNGLPPEAQQASIGEYNQAVQEGVNTKNQITALDAAINSAQAAIPSPSGNQSNSKSTSTQEDDAKAYNSASDVESITFSTRPRKNPLGQFASSTYQLTLYMITPDAYDAFLVSGRKNINALREATSVNDPTLRGGAFIVAQSGGINDQDRFKPEFQYDYYIDKLTATTYSSGSEVNSFDMKFNIIEPYGFSFISNLKRARDRLSTLNNTDYQLPGAERLFYILGFRFYGYDASGNILTGKETTGEGLVLDPNNSNNGLFEKFIDVAITELTFKLDGKATVYSVTTGTIGQNEGLGTKRGTIRHGFSFAGATIEEALSELALKLNKDEQELVKSEPRNTYAFEFIGKPDEVDRIKNSSLIVPNNNLKSSWNTSGATNTNQVTDGRSQRSTPNPNKRVFAANNGDIINDVVAMIFKQSTYMTDAMTALYNAKTFGKGDPVNSSPSTQQFTWYNLSCEVSNARFNNDLRDWTYNITYVIQPFATPAVVTPLLATNPKYNFYGPHKTYEYYFTGQNSEILSYEQSFNNNFYLTAIEEGLPTPGFSSSDFYPPSVPGKRPDVSRAGSFNKSVDTQNSVLSILYDPQAFIEGKLTIMGDPDYLMTPNPSSLNQVYNQFYGSDNYTINPNGGQVFITLDFKEAIDYDVNRGFLSVNDNVLFFKYPPAIQKLVKGVILQLIQVTSSFDGGKFTQVLTTAVPALWDSDEADQRVDTTEAPSDVRKSTTPAENKTLRPGPPPVSPELAGYEQDAAYVTDPQTGRALRLSQADVKYLSQQED